MTRTLRQKSGKVTSKPSPYDEFGDRPDKPPR